MFIIASSKPVFSGSGLETELFWQWHWKTTAQTLNKQKLINNKTNEIEAKKMKVTFAFPSNKTLFSKLQLEWKGGKFEQLDNNASEVD